MIDEKRRYEIDYWASLLKAIKWKDMKALMDTNLPIKEAATVSYQLTQKKQNLQQREAQGGYYRRSVEYQK